MQHPQRPGSMARQVAAPPPLPTMELASSVRSDNLIQFINSLALPSGYDLFKTNVRGLLKIALYSAICQRDPVRECLLFGGGGFPVLSSMTDDWSLSSVQGEEGSEYSEGRRGKVCGHVFRAGESVYRCRDCSLDSTCVLCAKCYHASSHKQLGHDVTVSIHGGLGAGCCDCGDTEAFKDGQLGNCKFHSIGEGGHEAKNQSESSPELTRDIEKLLRILLDWQIHIFQLSPEEMTAPKTAQDILALAMLGSTENDRRSLSSLRSGFGLSDSAVPKAVSGQGSSLAPVIAASSEESFNTAQTNAAEVSPSNDIRSQSSRGKARAASPPLYTTDQLTGPWSVVLWNDEKHSFAQVIDQVSRATKVSRREAADIAQTVDTYGRAVVYISTDPVQVVFVSRLIAAIENLAVSVRTSLDTYEEEVAGELINFIKDLCTLKLGGEGGMLTEALAKVLLEKGPDDQRSRFQKLLAVDSRLWKTARKNLAEVYVTMLGVSLAVKMELSVQFAQMYPNIAEAYLLTDREPENSIVFFGVQVFTVPSVSAFLVSQYHFLSGLLSILYSFFTEQLERRKYLILPPNLAENRVDLESRTFKQKRYFQIFSDLNHLISSDAVRRIICQSPSLINEFAVFLDLFTSMNPNQRAVNTHVEYESDTWVTAFNITIQLGKICRCFGEAFRLADPLQLAHALSALLARLAGSRETIHNVVFDNVVYRLIDFKVDSQPISFHHPLAWLFAEMVKNLKSLDAKALQSIGVPSLGAIALGRAGQLHFLAAMDHPLRVIVLVAQIRAGLWVRNGFGMRAQQLHYKEYSLRENTFDQDIFFLQTAFVVLDPSLVFVAILDRFQLQGWLAGEDAHPAYEMTQSFAMMEELLSLLIVLLSDPTNTAALSIEKILSRELIHNLCLGPSTYSDLMRRVSEKFTDDPALDRVLAEVAHFKLPVGTSDQGTYTLRPECFAHVNPYFPRYSRNQREEAEKFARAELKKQQPGVDPVIVPEPLAITQGPFVTLTQTFCSNVLHRLIYLSILYGKARGALFSEVLVDEGLHLAMLCLVEQPQSFAHFAEQAVSEVEGETSLIHLLVKVEEDDRIRAVRHKAKWCLNRLTELVGPAVSQLRKAEDQNSPAAAIDARRLAAKARQATIMKQFAQAQQSFLDSNENYSDDDDDDMMDEATSFGSCIVCQDDLESSRPFGNLTFIQTSNFLRQTPSASENGDMRFLNEILATSPQLNIDLTEKRNSMARSSNNSREDALEGVSHGFPQSFFSGFHASSCGHMMHLSCFTTYNKSVFDRQHQQPGSRCHPENVERQEFICPLCKSLGNVLLPVSVEKGKKYASHDTRTLEEWSNIAKDPVSLAEDLGIAKMDVWANRQLSRTSPEGRISIRAWTFGQSLPLAVPGALLENEQLMLHRMLQVVRALAEEVGGSTNASSAYLPTDLLAYTISAVEVASRGQLEPTGGVSSATCSMLKSLFQILSRLANIQTASEHSSELTALLTVVPNLGGIFSPQRRNDSLASLNPIATLVEGAAVVPTIFRHLVAICFYSELAIRTLSLYRILEQSKERLVWEHGQQDPRTMDYIALAQIRQYLPFTSETEKEMDALTFGKLLHTCTLPFLRRAVIIHQVVFGTRPSSADEDPSATEYQRLLEFLHIPSPASVFKADQTHSSSSVEGASTILAHLAALRDSLLHDDDMNNDTVTPSKVLPRSAILQASEVEHPTVYELVGLPKHLDSLAAESLRRKCQRCQKVPAEPALCLFCGQIVCNQSTCCMDGEEEAQFGECNMHMWTCGGSVGAYYIIKKNAILYLYTDKGTFSTPPYLDSHGEVDSGGRRGRTLFLQYLHPGRYDEIRKTWLQHGIPTFVARKLDAVTDNGGWETM